MIRDWQLDFVVVNGENSAGGFGITEAVYQEFLDAGADAITLGNHAWDQREALVFIERAPRLIRPANFPKGTPGRGAALVDTKNGKRALVVNAIGRVFMTRVIRARGDAGQIGTSLASASPCGWTSHISRNRSGPKRGLPLSETMLASAREKPPERGAAWGRMPRQTGW